MILSSPLSAYFGFCLHRQFFFTIFISHLMIYLTYYNPHTTETYFNISLFYQRTTNNKSKTNSERSALKRDLYVVLVGNLKPLMFLH